VKTRLLAGLAVALAACSQSGVAPPTQMSGTNSSVVSGSLLFVTSTRSNELRVLDLEPRPGLQRDFVRAPNPLSPLSIPTLPSPVELSTPTRYGPLGQPLQGDWVFARGTGSAGVSVVGALNCPQQLKEFGRITPRPDSVVTALTSRLTVDDLQAQLYFATFDGTDTTLWELLLPNLPRDRGTTVVDSRRCGLYPAALPPYVLQPLDVIRDEVVTAMVALPTVQHPGQAPDPEERRLVLATRLMHPPVPFVRPDMTEQGRIRVVTPQPSGLSDSFEAVFNSDTTVAESFPVKRLLTHGNVVKVVAYQDAGVISTVYLDTDGGIDGGITDVVMDAGTRIFGILDEASCGGTIDCVGVLAVDLDRTGQLPLVDGGSVIRFPVAIDGFDDRRDQYDDGGTVVFVDAGVPLRFPDTYYRPPNDFDGGVPRDANRMVPIRFSNSGSVGIVQDIVLQSSALVLYLDGFQRQYGLVGFVTLTGFGNSIPAAQIFAFDAMTLRQINFAGIDPGVSDNKPILNNGATASFRGGPQTNEIHIEQGVYPFSESVYVLYEGVVAGIAREPLDAGLGDPRQGTWPLSINSRILAERGYVEPGDIVVPVDYTGTECEFAFPVLPAGPDGGVLVPGPGGLFLVTRGFAVAETLDGGLAQLPDGGFVDGGSILVLADGTVPTIDSCPPPVSYNLRSSSLAVHPLTVSGTVAGWLGRMALPPPGGTSFFAVGATTTPQFVRFWRPDADAGTSAAGLPGAGLSFQIHDTITYPGAGADAGIEPILTQGDQPSLRGSGYVFTFLNGYSPASVPINSGSLGISGLNIPGALSLYQRNLFPLAQNAGQDRIFVLYPGGNVIVDFSPTTVTYTSNATVDVGVHF
jgi:hypothetical protein